MNAPIPLDPLVIAGKACASRLPARAISHVRCANAPATLERVIGQ